MPAGAFKDAVYPLAWQALNALEKVVETSEPNSLDERHQALGVAETEVLHALRSALAFCSLPALASQWPEETTLHRARTAQLIASVERHLDAWKEVALQTFWPAYRLSVRSLQEAVYDYLLLQESFCSAIMRGSDAPESLLSTDEEP